MSAYGNQVKSYIERYQAEMGGDGLLDPHAVAEWAYSAACTSRVCARWSTQLLLTSHSSSARSTAQMATVSAIAPSTQFASKKADKTMSLWADMDDAKAPRDHFVRSFAQRRQQIVGDCFQLKTDVDVYNEKNAEQRPIQVPLDFTLDVEELQLPLKAKKAA